MKWYEQIVQAKSMYSYRWA